ncbi:MAG TPA: PilZ domain-containing protein [Candidatus Eremiobacteraceae bacterium]
MTGILFAWSAKSAQASRERIHLRHPMGDASMLTSIATGEQAPVRLVNLSVGGARIQTTAGIKPGDQICLLLRVADGTELQLSAQVVHTLYADDQNGAEFGVRFNSTHAADRRLVSQYIHRLANRVAVGAAAD